MTPDMNSVLAELTTTTQRTIEAMKEFAKGNADIIAGMEAELTPEQLVTYRQLRALGVYPLDALIAISEHPAKAFLHRVLRRFGFIHR
jgi:hypothetical protein